MGSGLSGGIAVFVGLLPWRSLGSRWLMPILTECQMPAKRSSTTSEQRTRRATNRSGLSASGSRGLTPRPPNSE